MQLTDREILRLLNAPTTSERLNNLRALVARVKSGELPAPATNKDVNNHIHTTYSFSPYSPTAAVWFAWMAGLETCGIMDHDSVAGANEFTEAGGIIGMGTTVGIECRVKFDATQLNGKRINNPDQSSVAYIALHGIPHDMISKVDAFFVPYRAYRNNRNNEMIKNINAMLFNHDIALDFESDVVPLSQGCNGGSITERHIAYALSKALVSKLGKGQKLVDFLTGKLNLTVSAKVAGFLSDENNEHYMYDLLGLIKSDLISKFYIDATDECPDVRDVLALSEEISAISAYAYLGDVGESVTGDKRAQKFEDDYIDLLFAIIKELGFRAVTYMPSRNTTAQLDVIRHLCKKYSFFQISGEDINSPRQSFVCKAQRDPSFSNLYDATWALIAHEWCATKNKEDGLFSNTSIENCGDLAARVKEYSLIGQAMKF